MYIKYRSIDGVGRALPNSCDRVWNSRCWPITALGRWQKLPNAFRAFERSHISLYLLLPWLQYNPSLFLFTIIAEALTQTAEPTFFSKMWSRPIYLSNTVVFRLFYESVPRLRSVYTCLLSAYSPFPIISCLLFNTSLFYLLPIIKVVHIINKISWYKKEK